MSSSSFSWRSVSILAGVATLLLICGFVYAVREIVHPSAASGMQIKPGSSAVAQVSPPGRIGVVVIGDSLAKGTGDDQGKGFGQRTVDLMKAGNKNRDVMLLGNLGINGLLTSGLADELGDTGVKHMLQEANLILLSIGGNDLFQGAEAMESGEDLPTKKELNQSIDSASVRFKAVVKQIEVINPKAKLVYIGLYNPFSDLKEMKKVGDSGVARWNSSVQTALSLYDNALVIPTYDLFAGNLAKYLSGDHFHPNGDGYEQIATRIVQSLD